MDNIFSQLEIHIIKGLILDFFEIFKDFQIHLGGTFFDVP